MNNCIWQSEGDPQSCLLLTLLPTNVNWPLHCRSMARIQKQAMPFVNMSFCLGMCHENQETTVDICLLFTIAFLGILRHHSWFSPIPHPTFIDIWNNYDALLWCESERRHSKIQHWWDLQHHGIQFGEKDANAWNKFLLILLPPPAQCYTRGVIFLNSVTKLQLCGYNLKMCGELSMVELDLADLGQKPTWT